jgi:Pentapeptide repeats (8 copies)
LANAQLAVFVAMFAALLAAAVSVFVGVSTVASSERSASQTAFIGAIQSLGGETAVERASGAVLARSIVHQQLVTADDPPWIYSVTGQVQPMRDQATANYRSALRAIEVTLRLGPTLPSPEMVAPIDCKGPPPGREVTYQANEFKSLLYDQQYYDDIVAQTGSGVKPAIDLSRVNLCGQYWVQLDLSQLHAAYLRKINLRFADLTGAHLDGVALLGADLTSATISGATVTNTDFTCALGLDTVNFTDVDVGGAVFTGTKVTEAQLRLARGTPKKLPELGDPPCR